MNLAFDYTKEPSRSVFCIDVRSFYASVECVERGPDPLKTVLVAMSNSKNSGGLILAASSMAKKALGISNVTREDEVPDHPNLIIIPSRMKSYMEKNQEINNLYKRFISDKDHSIFSVGESFLGVIASLTHFKCDTVYKLAKIIQRMIYNHMELHVTIGIRENPLSAKLVLDNEIENAPGFVIEWHYEDVPEKVWSIFPLTEFCGIGNYMAICLRKLGIRSIYDLAHTEPYMLKEHSGIMGLQLYAHS